MVISSVWYSVLSHLPNLVETIPKDWLRLGVLQKHGIGICNLHWIVQCIWILHTDNLHTLRLQILIFLPFDSFFIANNFLRKLIKFFGRFVNQNEACRNLIHQKEKNKYLFHYDYFKIEHFQIYIFVLSYMNGIMVLIF